MSRSVDLESCITLAPKRADVLLVAAVALALDLPILVLRHYASHDLLETLSCFNYLYSGLLYDHAIPQWNPLVFYGIWTGIQQFTVSPFSYAFGLIGYLSDWHNAARLLYVSLAVERVFFAVSLYYLSLTLYRTRVAAVLVPCVGAAAVFWFFVPAFNLYAIAFLPLALLFLTRFWTSGSWVWLWLCGAVLAASVTFPLMAPVMALCFGAIGLALVLQHPSPATFIGRPSPAAVAAFLLCALMVAADGALLAHALNALDLLAKSRTTEGSVSLHTFLDYSVAPTLDAAAQDFVLGYTKTAQWPSYFGLLPLIGALVAIATLDGKVLRSFALGAFVILLLTNASAAAVLMFHFPTMQFFRHLQHLFPVLKVFLLVLAGFTLDRMVSDFEAPERRPRWLKPWPLLLALLVLGSLVDVVAGPVLREANPAALGFAAASKGDGHVFAVYMSYLRVFIYGIAALVACVLISRSQVSGTARPAIMKALLIGAVAFDLASYQWQTFHQWTWDTTNDPGIRTAFQAKPPVLPMQRERTPPTQDVAKVIAGFADHAKALKSTNYAVYETLLNFDRCFPVGRVHYFAAGAARLIALRGGVIVPGAAGSKVPWHDSALMDVLGCGKSKFRLVRNAELAHSVTERERLIQQTSALDRTVIIGPLDPGQAEPSIAAGQPPVNGGIRLIRYTADRIDLEVDNPASAPVWLVYADAYDPGWSAMVDHNGVTTYQAYGAFKAILVPPGVSHVEWRFSAGVASYLLLLLRILPGLAGLAALAIMIFAPHAWWKLTSKQSTRIHEGPDHRAITCSGRI